MSVFEEFYGEKIMSVQVSYKKQTTLGIIGLLILFLIIELIANVWWVTQMSCEFEENEIFQQMDNEKKRQLCVDLYNIQTSGTELIPNQQSQTVSINNLGFRGEEFSIEKPSDTYRIFMLGGSTMFGYGATSDQTTIPGYLQESLKEFNSKYTIEVINAGIQGADSFSELNLLERKLINFAPDLVIIYDGWNDLRAENSAQKIQNNWKSVCELGNKKGFDTVVTLQPIAGFGNKQLTEQEMIYSATGQNYNGDLLINDFSEYEKYAINLDTLTGCTKSLNLVGVFDKETSPIYWDQGHVSDYGNYIVSQELYREILEILPITSQPQVQNFTNDTTKNDNEFYTQIRYAVSTYKTPLMLNSIFSFQLMQEKSVLDTNDNIPTKSGIKIFKTQSKIYNENSVSIIIKLLEDENNFQKKLEIITMNNDDNSVIPNVTYFLKIQKDDTIILSDFFFVENDALILDVIPINSDSIEISGKRQYEHNAIIATESSAVKLSGPLLLPNEDYEFIIELRTVYDKSNWVFSLDGFSAKIVS